MDELIEKSCYRSRPPYYIAVLFAAVKILGLINIILQLLWLHWMIGSDYLFFGFEILLDLLRGKDWKISSHFPRLTLCDFDIRTLGNVHHHTVQCVLPINALNEKIFIFLWFWMVLLICASIINISYWARIYWRSDRLDFYIIRSLISSRSGLSFRVNIKN